MWRPASARRGSYSRMCWLIHVVSVTTWETVSFGDARTARTRRRWNTCGRGRGFAVLEVTPKRAHGLRPFLVLADEPAQWEHGKAEAMASALRTGLGKTPGSRLIALGTLPADGQHWFSQMLRDAPYHQLHAAPKDAPIFRASTWAKANPSMRYLPSLKAEIKAEAISARRDGVMLQSFKSLRLNMGLADVVSGVLLEAGTWESIEGEAERDGPYVLGLDLGGSTAQSAACAFYPASGRLEGFAIFPENPESSNAGDERRGGQSLR